MIIYRIFLFSFLSISWLLLSGFYDSVVVDTSTSDKSQKVIVEKDAVATIPADSKTNVNTLNVNEKKRVLKKRRNRVVEIRNTNQFDEFVKPLDISIPVISLEPDDMKAVKKKNEDDQSNEFFDPKPKKRRRSLELDGNFLMSPEPEVERKKTVDGAGISINVKPD